MTETPPPPTSPTPPFREELVRLEEDRLWLGVCAAIGRATGTDPVLWRVAIIVLTFFGGSGLLVYGAGWLLIRNESEPRSIAERLLRGRGRRFSATNIVVFGLMGLGALALLELLTPWDGSHGPSLAPLAVVALLAYVVLRRQPAAIGTAGPTGPAPRSAPATSPTTFAGTAAASPSPTPYAPVEAPAPPVRKRRKRTGPPVAVLTFGAALAVTGLLVALAVLGVDGITVPRTLAAVLAVFGVGLIVGARYGRQLLLITLALLTAGALNVTARVDVPWDGSIGERTWTVDATDNSAEHQLGVGEGRLDLRGLVLQQDTTVQASVGFGHLWITVPDGVRVHLIGTVSVGAYDVFLPGVRGADRHGDGNDIAVDTTYGPDSGPVLTLDTEVGVGYLEVDHA